MATAQRTWLTTNLEDSAAFWRESSPQLRSDHLDSSIALPGTTHESRQAIIARLRLARQYAALRASRMIQSQKLTETKRRADATSRHQNMSAELTRRRLIDEQKPVPVQRRGNQNPLRGVNVRSALDLKYLSDRDVEDFVKRAVRTKGNIQDTQARTTAFQTYQDRRLAFKSVSATTRIFIQSGNTFTNRRTKTTVVTPTTQLLPPIFVKSGTTYTNRRTKFLPVSSKTASPVGTDTTSSVARRTKTLIHSSSQPSNTSDRPSASETRKTKTPSGTGTSGVPRPTPSAQCASDADCTSNPGVTLPPNGQARCDLSRKTPVCVVGCQSGFVLRGNQCVSNEATCDTTTCPTPPPGGAYTCTGDDRCELICDRSLKYFKVGNTCINTAVDPSNCGSIGSACPGGYNGLGTPTCTFGVCGLSCPPGTIATDLGGMVYCARF